MSDTIFVSGLLIHAHHGVMPHEEQVGQQFVIDLELAIDLAPAAASDKLVDTVSYASIVEAAARAFTCKSYRLVEVAGRRRRSPTRVLSSFVRVASGARDRPQAACADRGDLQRRRRHHPAPAPWLRAVWPRP